MKNSSCGELNGIAGMSGAATRTTLSDSGEELVYGKDSFATISSGGYQHVEAGGTATYATIENGGTMAAGI